MTRQAQGDAGTEGDASGATQEPNAAARGRRQFELDDRGFDEVPRKYRKYYRRWEGPGDALGPNEVLCPVCKIVVRSARELREGDRVYCMACMTRMRVRRGAGAAWEADVEY